MLKLQSLSTKSARLIPGKLYETQGDVYVYAVVIEQKKHGDWTNFYASQLQHADKGFKSDLLVRISKGEIMLFLKQLSLPVDLDNSARGMYDVYEFLRPNTKIVSLVICAPASLRKGQDIFFYVKEVGIER